MKNYFESVTKEVFGEEFKCKVTSDIIYLISKNGDYGFQFIMSKYDYQRVFRDNFCVFKRFDEVERVIIPLCIKHNVLYTQYNKFAPTVQTYPQFSEVPDINHIFFRKRTMVHVNNKEAIYKAMNELKIAVEYEKDNFIKKYNLLENVFETSELNTLEQNAEFICNPVVIRQLFLKYVFDNDNYETYFQERNELLVNAVKKESEKYEGFHKTFLELDAILRASDK